MCAIVSLTGVLAVTFVPAFLRELRFSKVTEASQRLDDLYRRSAAYYALDHTLDGQTRRGCLPESAGPTPSTPSRDPVWTDFVASNVAGHDTWRALGQNEPVSVRYAYEARFLVHGCAPHSAAPRPIAEFRASGDLDGDGVLSTLMRAAVLSSGQESLLPSGPLHIDNRVE